MESKLPNSLNKQPEKLKKQEEKKRSQQSPREVKIEFHEADPDAIHLPPAESAPG